MPFIIGNNNIVPSWKRAGTYEPSPELSLIIERATIEGFTIPSQRTQRFIDILIQALKDFGVWNLQDSLFNFAYNNLLLADFSRINYVNPMSVTNLALWSTDFSNTVWEYVNNTKSPNTLNTTAPDGTFTACEFESLGVSGNAQQLNIIANNTTLTYSIFVKGGTATEGLYRLRDDSTATVVASATINYSNGTLTAITGTAFSEDIGNGWYKLSLTAVNCVINNSYRIYIGNLGTKPSGETWYLWHPMVTDLNFSTNLFEETFANPIYGYGICTAYGGLSYVVYGWEGNGVDAFLDTNFNPFLSTGNWQANSSGMSCIVSKLYTTNPFPICQGVWGSTNNTLLSTINTSTQLRVNSATAILTDGNVDMSGLGYTYFGRNSTTLAEFTKTNNNGTRTFSSSGLIVNGRFALLRAVSSGIYSDIGLSLANFGSPLITTQRQNIRIAYNQYLQNIGLSPID